MRKLFVLFFAMLLSLPAFAQLEVKPGSFKEVPGFVNINPDPDYQFDDNDKPFAVLLIKTENINEEQRARLRFYGDAQTYILVEQRVGEVCLYISYYASFLKISHPDFSTAEYRFPIDMQPKKGYELTLVNKDMPVNNGWGSLTVNTKPENGAKILLNGRDFDATTPYSNNMIPSGKYEITVSKDRYKTVTEIVDVADGDKKTVDIEMPIDVAVIILTADAQTSVYVDGEYKKSGTWSGELKSGNYDIVYKKQYHQDAKQIITVEGGVPKTYEIKLLPINGELTVNSEPSNASIFIDGKNYGVTPAEITDIIIGPHELRLEKDSYGIVMKQFVLEEGKLLTINETLPTGREISISTDKKGDQIYVDGNYLGTSPMTATLSFGEHNVKAVRDGKETSKKITVAQNDSENAVKLTFEFKNKTFTVNGASFEMIAVKGGKFTMGGTSEQDNEAESDEKPTHRVTLSDYYIGKFEVTQELWQAVMGNNPSYYKGNNLPVEQVSWNDVQEFIKKLNQKTGANFRLPTEAEWEYAARGGTKSRGYKYSGSNSINDVAWYTSTTNDKGTKPVGTKSPNELGIYDMSGNVCEWCQDWYGSYSSGSQTNPNGASSGSNRLARGGSWFYHAKYCRVSYRNNYTPDYGSNLLGFRLAADK